MWGRARHRERWPTIWAVWGRVCRPLPSLSARSGTTPWSWWCPNSAGRFARTAIVERITATVPLLGVGRIDQRRKDLRRAAASRASHAVSKSGFSRAERLPIGPGRLVPFAVGSVARAKRGYLSAGRVDRPEVGLTAVSAADYPCCRAGYSRLSVPARGPGYPGRKGTSERPVLRRGGPAESRCRIRRSG